ncbi:MAG: NUDIX domain-containing protein [Acidimicrobiaceae bacterium]|nr:NUDIX domain-containing protein [Acidimicrobiaceae bacterium]
MSTSDRVAADYARFREWARYAHEHGDSPAIAAATVVLLRNAEDGIETLMLRKNSKIAFGGMWVFPGGRVDDSDRIGAGGTTLDDVAAARNAAAREAHEEAEIDVDPDSMVIFAHWIPPAIAPKRYATWFFAARVKDRRDDEGAVRVDEGEIVEGEWMTPKACLQRHHEGEVELAPPTWVTLATLRGHNSAEAALDYLKTRTPRHHATRIGNSEQGPVAMWAGDGGYEANDATLGGPRHRLEMFPDGYRYVDTLEEGLGPAPGQDPAQDSETPRP